MVLVAIKVNLSYIDNCVESINAKHPKEADKQCKYS